MSKRVVFGWKIARDVFNKTGGKCYYCGCVLPENSNEFDERGNIVVSTRNWHVDHMLPISREGTNKIDNLVPACWDCNEAKRAMTADEFMAARAR